MAEGAEKQNVNRWWWMLIPVMLCWSHTVKADNTVILQAGYERYSLNSYLSYLVDVEGGRTLDQVLAEDSWQSNVAGTVLNFGFTHATVWVRTRLRLPDSPGAHWHLVVPYPLLEHARLFLRSPETSSEWVPLYSDREAGQRPVPSHHVNFALADNLQGDIELVLQVRSTTSLQIPIELWARDYLVSRQNTETLYWGLYFGVLLALMAYNLFLYLSMRDGAYLNYVFYLVSIQFLMLCISGFGLLHVWSSPQWTRYLLPVSAGLTSFWAILFALSFLHRSGIHPGLRLLLQGVAGMSLALLPYAFIQPAQGAQLAGLLAVVSVILVIAAGLNALLSGAVIARYFVLAWAMFALGSFLYLLNIFGLIPVSQFSNHAVQVGSALEAVLLSFALAHRIKEERQQKLNALEEKSLAEQQIKQVQSLALEQALHDALTQRPNDALVLRRVQELIRQQAGLDAFALVLFYFPQMKEISSSLGRRLAEELFCSVVEDLNQAMEQDPRVIAVEPSTQSCVAVPEFGALVALCAIDTAFDSLQDFANRYLSFYEQAIDIDGISLNLTIVCGIASFPKHGDRADLLLQHASAARDFGLRTAETVTIYSSEIESFGRRRLTLVGALIQAIRDGELELYLQPQLQCCDLTLTGAEVLLRWNSPRFGVVAPQEFIEIAEEAGLIGLLTRYVIERAFGILRGFQQHGLRISISINLSIRNLIEPGIVNFVTTQACQQQINLADIVLEVTETSMSENMETVIDNLQQLASTGCCIALDDFGTGYSSLAYLSRLPIHELKIDRSFIAQMNRSTSDYRIVENTVKLARALQIQTVAEGVEDAATLEQIERLGCDRAQGFYLGKPMPLAQFREWVIRRPDYSMAGLLVQPVHESGER
ncbi:MAG TPA: EAL domain-containing protein [Dongiaceae bacterium]|nr:EAL domain-containing protein [Dongiaceae bacterium]